MTRLGWNDPKRTHPCDLCGGRRYVGAAGLKAHRIVAHGPNPYECQGCQQKFKSRGDLERHMDTACPARVAHIVPTQPPAALPVEEEEEVEEEEQFIPHVLNSNDDVASVKQEILVEDDSHPIQSDLESEDLAERSIEMINPTLNYNGSHVRDISMDGSTIALSDTDRQASNIDIEEAERAMAAAFKILAQTAPTKWTPPNVGAEVPIEIIREVASKYKVTPVQEIEKPVIVKEEPVIVFSEPPSLYSILTSPFGQSLEMSAFTLFLGLVLYFSFTIPAASLSSTVFFFVIRSLITILTTTVYHLALASFSLWASYALVEKSAKAYHRYSHLTAADGLLQLAQHGIADRFSAVSPSTQTQESVSLTISCGVCGNPPNELTATTCGHLFCRDCVVRSLDLNPLCPTCEKEIDATGGLVEICI